MPRLLKAFAQWMVQTGDASDVAGLRDAAERALKDLDMPSTQAAAVLAFTWACDEELAAAPSNEVYSHEVMTAPAAVPPEARRDFMTEDVLDPPGMPRSA